MRLYLLKLFPSDNLCRMENILSDAEKAHPEEIRETSSWCIGHHVAAACR